VLCPKSGMTRRQLILFHCEKACMGRFFVTAITAILLRLR
jgi:hypothetical protein